jgi:protein-tyrosine-phosphatase
MKILFVCTDNIARSLAAEYLLKNWLQKNNRYDIEVSSCGINADSDTSSFCMDHLDKLTKMGIDISMHKRTQLTEDVLKKNDLVIAMDESHQNWIKEKFNLDIPLYNEIYKNEKTSIRITPLEAGISLSDKLLNTVDYINQSIPELVIAIDKIKFPPTT